MSATELHASPVSSADTTPERWRDHECTGCGTTLTAGAATFTLKAERYQPLQPGPAWECVGDWTEQGADRVAGTVCEPCLDAVVRTAMAHAFNRPLRSERVR